MIASQHVPIADAMAERMEEHKEHMDKVQMLRCWQFTFADGVPPPECQGKPA